MSTDPAAAQADQIFNLSLTRTATRTLVARGTQGVIGVGRVKTPTLGILCLRELEIRGFKSETYFEIVAKAKVDAGSFVMRNAPPAKARITDAGRATAIATASAKFTGPVAVTVEARRQAPPRLYDLPALQKTCSQRWGWTADKTLAVAQELYDGDGKKVITYPRAEARHLTENQIADVPGIVSAMLRLRGFAHLSIDPPVIRRGKSGHFCDKALEGVSHHAIVPNVNVMDDLETRIARLCDDEKRLFALLCRSYLAAVSPDYEYQRTTVTLQVPVPELGALEKAEFRAVGRMPLKPGWKAVYGASEQETEPADKARKGGKDGDDADGDANQALPPLRHGEAAALSRPKVQEKKTIPPPRYNEGTLVDAMQNAWRFVEDDALRERLKEAKGIGTPATRAEIINGLKRQSFVAAEGRNVVPTSAGLQLFDLLRAAAPSLVVPGTTAIWEMRLDDVVVGKADFRAVIEEIAAEAERLIQVLRRHSGVTVDLASAPGRLGTGVRGRKRTFKTKRADSNADGKRAPGTGKSVRTRSAAAKGKALRSQASGIGGPEARAETTRARAAVQTREQNTGSARPPTERMMAFAQRLARDRKAKLPAGWDKDFETCRSFLSQNVDRD